MTSVDSKGALESKAGFVAINIDQLRSRQENREFVLHQPEPTITTTAPAARERLEKSEQAYIPVAVARARIDELLAEINSMKQRHLALIEQLKGSYETALKDSRSAGVQALDAYKAKVAARLKEQKDALLILEERYRAAQAQAEKREQEWLGVQKELDHQLDTARSDARSAEEKSLRLAEQVNQAREAAEALQKRIPELQTEMAMQSGAYDQILSAKELLEAQVIRLERESDQARAQEREAVARVQMLQNTVLEAERAQQASQARIAEMETELDELRRQRTELEQQLESKTQWIAEHSGDASELEQERLGFASERTRLTQQVAQLEGEINQRIEEWKRVEVEKGDLSRQLSETMDKLRETEAELAASEQKTGLSAPPIPFGAPPSSSPSPALSWEEKQRLEGAVSSLRDDLRQKDREITQLRREQEQAQSQLLRLREAQTQLQTQLDLKAASIPPEVSAQIAALETELETARRETNRLRAELRDKMAAQLFQTSAPAAAPAQPVETEAVKQAREIQIKLDTDPRLAMVRAYQLDLIRGRDGPASERPFQRADLEDLERLANLYANNLATQTELKSLQSELAQLKAQHDQLKARQDLVKEEQQQQRNKTAARSKKSASPVSAPSRPDGEIIFELGQLAKEDQKLLASISEKGSRFEALSSELVRREEERRELVRRFRLDQLKDESGQPIRISRAELVTVCEYYRERLGVESTLAEAKLTSAAAVSTAPAVDEAAVQARLEALKRLYEDEVEAKQRQIAELQAQIASLTRQLQDTLRAASESRETASRLSRELSESREQNEDALRQLSTVRDDNVSLSQQLRDAKSREALSTPPPPATPDGGTVVAGGSSGDVLSPPPPYSATRPSSSSASTSASALSSTEQQHQLEQAKHDLARALSETEHLRIRLKDSERELMQAQAQLSEARREAKAVEGAAGAGAASESGLVPSTASRPATGSDSAGADRASLERLERQFEAEKASVARLGQEKAQVETLNASLQQSLAETKTQVSSLEQQLAALRTMSEQTASGQLMSVQARASELESQLQTARARVSELEQLSEKLRAQATGETAKLASDLEAKHRTQVAAVTSDYENKAEQLRDELKRLQQAMEQAVEAEKSIAAEQAKTYEQRLSEAAQQVSGLNEEISKLTEQAKADSATLRSQLVADFEGQTKELIAKHEQELKSLKVAEADLQTQLQKAQNDITSLTDRLTSETEAKVSALQSLAELNDKHSKLLEETAGIRATADTLKNTLSVREKTIADQESKITSQEKELQDCKGQIDHLNGQVIEEQKRRKHFQFKYEEVKGKIRVYARVRPLSSAERGDKMIIRQSRNAWTVELCEMKQSVQGGEGKENWRPFSFDAVFLPGATQEQVFEECRGFAELAVTGINCCIFAYGQSGTGKTFTMLGKKPDMLGLKPRMIQEIYRIKDEMKATHETKIGCYMVEIYLNKVYDVFDKLDTIKARGKKTKLEPKELTIKIINKKVFLDKVKEKWEFKDTEDMGVYVDEAEGVRISRRTGLNEESSRSHLVFALQIDQTEIATGKTTRGKLSLVDLAGSERVEKTSVAGLPPAETEQMLKEGKAINDSLFKLKNVFRALGANQDGSKKTGQREEVIQYRGNALTELMQDSLGGKARTLMFVNVGPSEKHMAESLDSLSFADLVQNVSNEVASADVDLTNQIAVLKEKLEAYRTRFGAIDG